MRKIICAFVFLFSFFAWGNEQGEFRDGYKELGVSHTASSEEIQKAYRKKIKEIHPHLHPDKNRDELIERFDSLKRIKDMLLDPTLREEYDQMLEEQETRRANKPANQKKKKAEPHLSSLGEGGTLLHELLPMREMGEYYPEGDKKGYGIAHVLLDYKRGKEKSKANTLIKKGVDINAKNKAGETALLLSIKWYYPDVFNLLLAHRADPNLSDSQNNTPAHWMVARPNKYFRSYDGAEVFGPLEINWWPFNNRRTRKLLRPLFVNFNFELWTKEWFSPLFEEKDLDLSIRNDQGMTALELAVQNGYLEIARLMILKKGTDYLHPEERERILRQAIKYKWPNSFIKRLADKYNPKTSCQKTFAPKPAEWR